MVVQEQTLYAGGAVVNLVAALVLALLVRRFDGNGHRHAVFLPVALGILTLGYAGMSLELFVETSLDGEPVYFTRYGTYLATYTFLMTYIGLVAGAGLRYRLIPAVSVVGFTLGTIVTQLAPPPLDSVGSLALIASLVAVFWVFFGPLPRAAADVSRERRLLFAKLRNFAALIFIMYLLVSLTNRAGVVELLDAFVGVVTIMYVDIIAHVGLAGIIIYSRTAVGMVAAECPSPLSMFTTGRS
jgi:bacteriorhodopsin